jgi:hypothetical protein
VLVGGAREMKVKSVAKTTQSTHIAFSLLSPFSISTRIFSKHLPASSELKGTTSSAAGSESPESSLPDFLLEALALLAFFSGRAATYWPPAGSCSVNYWENTEQTESDSARGRRDRKQQHSQAQCFAGVPATCLAYWLSLLWESGCTTGRVRGVWGHSPSNRPGGGRGRRGL